MYKLIIVIFLLIFSASAYAEREYGSKDIDFNMDLMIAKDKNGRLVNGVVKKYNNSLLAEEFRFKDGMLDGISKVYYDTGELQYDIPYKQSKKHGILKEYYKNGKVKSEFPFTEDTEQGIYKEYHENSKLSRQIFFNKGRMHGVERRYDDKGKQWLEISYQNDTAVSGSCIRNGRRYLLNEKEIIDWNRGIIPDCSK